MSRRDEFPAQVRRTVALRVNYWCSNPECRAATVGPHSDPNKANNLGRAAHITAAASNGPRYDKTLTPAQRKDISNSIWLCLPCSTKIDNDPVKYPVTLLHQWKKRAEEKAFAEMCKVRAHESLGDLQLQELRLLREKIEELRVTGKNEAKGPTRDEGQDLGESGQLNLRAARLRVSIEREPSNPRNWRDLANTLYNSHDLDGAFLAINNAERSGDLRNDLQFVAIKACVLAEYAKKHGGHKSMLREAIQLFESLYKVLSPASVDYNIGNCYEGLNEYENAIKYFLKAIKRNPPSDLAASIWVNCGNCYADLNKREEAVNAFHKALEHAPDKWQAYASLASEANKQNKYEETESLLRKCFALNPDVLNFGVDQLYVMAHVLWHQEKTQEALEFINRTLWIRPDDSNALVVKKHIISKLWRGDEQFIDAGIDFYSKVIIDNSEDLFARGELILLHTQKGNASEAQELIEQAIISNNPPTQALYHYAIVLEKQDRFLEAIDCLEKAFATSEEHHICHALGRIYQKAENYSEAIKYYKLALKDVCDASQIFQQIGDCYYFLSDFEECIRYESAIVRLKPSDLRAWNNLRYAFQQIGKVMLIWIFEDYVARLRHGQDVTPADISAVTEEFFRVLVREFGATFVSSIDTIGNPEKQESQSR